MCGKTRQDKWKMDRRWLEDRQRRPPSTARTRRGIDFGRSRDTRCNEYDGGQSAGFKRRVQQVFISKGPQEEAGSWVQGQTEGHTKGLQKSNSTDREKANIVVREIRQEVDDRKSDRQKYR